MKIFGNFNDIPFKLQNPVEPNKKIAYKNIAKPTGCMKILNADTV